MVCQRETPALLTKDTTIRRTPMPLHPTIQGMLDKIAGLPPMHNFTPSEIRATDLARYAAVPRIEVGHVEDRTIPGPRGELKIRIYRPDMAGGGPPVNFFPCTGFF